MVDTALLIDELDNLSPEDLDDDLSTRSEALSETSKEGSSAKRSWTEDEDQRLLKLVEEHGPRRWAHLSTMIPGRAGKQCIAGSSRHSGLFTPTSRQTSALGTELALPSALLAVAVLRTVRHVLRIGQDVRSTLRRLQHRRRRSSTHSVTLV